MPNSALNYKKTHSPTCECFTFLGGSVWMPHHSFECPKISPNRVEHKNGDKKSKKREKQQSGEEEVAGAFLEKQSNKKSSNGGKRGEVNLSSPIDLARDER